MPKQETDLSYEDLRKENQRLRSDLKYFKGRYRWLEAFIHKAPFAVYIKNRERQYSLLNPVRQQQLGLEPDEILWHTDLDLVGNLWAVLAHEQDAKVLASNQVAETLESAPYADPDGRKWLVVRFPFTGPDGEPCIGAVALDTSQQFSQSELSHP